MLRQELKLGTRDRFSLAHGPADEPLFEAIIKKLRMLDFAGATVYRGILGYGAKRHTHKGGRLHFSHDLPVMISVVERAERVQELITIVSQMMSDGLIVTSDVELHQIKGELPSAGGMKTE